MYIKSTLLSHSFGRWNIIVGEDLKSTMWSTAVGHDVWWEVNDHVWGRMRYSFVDRWCIVVLGFMNVLSDAHHEHQYQAFIKIWVCRFYIKANFEHVAKCHAMRPAFCGYKAPLLKSGIMVRGVKTRTLLFKITGLIVSIVTTVWAVRGMILQEFVVLTGLLVFYISRNVFITVDIGIQLTICLFIIMVRPLTIASLKSLRKGCMSNQGGCPDLDAVELWSSNVFLINSDLF